MSCADPIFIHAWWRSGSTYIWSKLRENESCRCYYEPLHEKIAGLNLAAIEGPAEVSVSRALRHPITRTTTSPSTPNFSVLVAFIILPNWLTISIYFNPGKRPIGFAIILTD